MPPPFINHNHDKTQELLSADIDNETDSIQKLEVDTHIGHCDNCRELFEKMQFLSHFTRLWPDESISADLEQKVRNNFDGIKIHFGKEPVTKESLIARIAVIAFIALVIFLVSSDIVKNMAEEKKRGEEAARKSVENDDTKAPVVNITIMSNGGSNTSSQESKSDNYQISYDKNSKVNINVSSSEKNDTSNLDSSEKPSQSPSSENQENHSAQNNFPTKNHKNSADNERISTINESTPEELAKTQETTETSNQKPNGATEDYQSTRQNIDKNDFQKRHAEIRNLSDEEYKSLYENQFIKQSQLLQELIPEESTPKSLLGSKTQTIEIIHDTEFDFQFKNTKEFPDVYFPTSYGNDHFQEMITSILDDQLPKNKNIHIGEMINFFSYPFIFTPDSTHSEPILYNTHLLPCSWNSNHYLLIYEISPQSDGDKTRPLDIIQSQISFNPQVIQSYKFLGLQSSKENTNPAFNILKKPLLMLFEINLGQDFNWEKLGEIDLFTFRLKFLNPDQQPISWTKAIFKSEIKTDLTLPLAGLSAIAEFALILSQNSQRGISSYEHTIKILNEIDWPEITQRKGLIKIIRKAKSIDYRVYNNARKLFSDEF